MSAQPILYSKECFVHFPIVLIIAGALHAISEDHNIIDRQILYVVSVHCRLVLVDLADIYRRQRNNIS